MSTLPVYNVSTPHLARIPGSGLQHGTMLRIKGTMTHAGDRFTINVQTGPALNPCDDINLHLSVRPNERVIVRNHQRSNVWGPEERYGTCPIHPGVPFELIVLAQTSGFKVAINGAHFCEFSHRLPMYSGRFVALSGAVTVQSITLEFDGPNGGGAVQPPPYLPPVVAPIGIYPPMPVSGYPPTHVVSQPYPPMGGHQPGNPYPHHHQGGHHQPPPHHGGHHHGVHHHPHIQPRSDITHPAALSYP